jgi:hypothetical protein
MANQSRMADCPAKSFYAGNTPAQGAPLMGIERYNCFSNKIIGFQKGE